MILFSILSGKNSFCLSKETEKMTLERELHLISVRYSLLLREIIRKTVVFDPEKRFTASEVLRFISDYNILKNEKNERDSDQLDLCISSLAFRYNTIGWNLMLAFPLSRRLKESSNRPSASAWNELRMVISIMLINSSETMSELHETTTRKRNIAAPIFIFFTVFDQSHRPGGAAPASPF